MSEARDVLPVNALVSRSVLSLSTGNKLGEVRDLFIDPVNGTLIGLTISWPDGSIRFLDYEHIYSFGHDAIMADSEAAAIGEAEALGSASQPNARDLIGTKLITASGNLLGQIADVFVTADPPPFVFYEIRESVFDKLLGRQLFVPASAGHALSDDKKLLIVPDETKDIASASIAALLDGQVAVRSYSPAASSAAPVETDDTLVIVSTGNDGDETILRVSDGDETVTRDRDDDDTILRLR